MEVKQILENLYNIGFFRNPQTTKQVQEFAYQEFGFTYSNWNIALRRFKQVRNVKGKWIQKIDPPSKSKKIYFVSGKKGWSDRNQLLAEIVGLLDGEVLIVDPYIGANTLHMLALMSNAKSVKFLTKTQNGDLTTQFPQFKKEFQNFQFKKTTADDLHDRYIISKKYFVIIGHGLKDLGGKESFLICFERQEVAEVVDELEKSFTKKWSAGNYI